MIFLTSEIILEGLDLLLEDTQFNFINGNDEMKKYRIEKINKIKETQKWIQDICKEGEMNDYTRLYRAKCKRK